MLNTKLFLLIIALLVILSDNSLAYTISTQTYGSISTQQGYTPYYFEDHEEATSGSVSSYIDHNSTYSDPSDSGPLVTDVTSSVFASASSTGSLIVSSQTEKVLSATHYSSFTSEASWQNTIDNFNASGLNYSLNLSISAVNLIVSKNSGDATMAQSLYETNVLLNGEIIWSIGDSICSYGYDPYNPFSPNTFSLSIPAAIYSISLGSYNPGDSFELEVQAFASTSLWDDADRASYVNLFTVSPSVIVAASGSTAPVPEPSTLLLLFIGFAVIVIKHSLSDGFPSQIMAIVQKS